MIIKERIKLGKTNYYISIDCEYKIKNGFARLCLKNNKNDYYDGVIYSVSYITKEELDKYIKEKRDLFYSY